MDIIPKMLIFVSMLENYFDLHSEEGKAILTVVEEWLCTSYGSMENMDIIDIFLYGDEIFVELNIFANGKYYNTSRRMPDEWFRRHKRDCKLKELGI